MKFFERVNLLQKPIDEILKQAVITSSSNTIDSISAEIHSPETMGLLNTNAQVVLLFASAVIVALLIPSLIDFISRENKIQRYIHFGQFGINVTMNIICRTLWAAAFALNLFTVSLPGRFDGQAVELQKQKDAAKSPEEIKKIESEMPWVTLFEPAPWAFAIWGVIYSSELLLTAFVTIFGHMQASMIEKATPYWLAGNMFQSLWCLCFRPSFRKVLWLPMMFLALASTSFFAAHREITLLITASKTPFMGKFGLLLCRFPLALHAAWLAAATVLNLNAWISVSNASTAFQVPVAYLSGLIAFAVGGLMTVFSGDPWIALTAAWALSAVRSRTILKLAKAGKSAQVLQSLAKMEQVWVALLLAIAVGRVAAELLGLFSSVR